MALFPSQGRRITPAMIARAILRAVEECAPAGTTGVNGVGRAIPACQMVECSIFVEEKIEKNMIR